MAEIGRSMDSTATLVSAVVCDCNWELCNAAPSPLLSPPLLLFFLLLLGHLSS